MRVARPLGLGLVVALAVAGCGAPRATSLVTASRTAVLAQDDSDHAQMNAIVKSVLTQQWTEITKGTASTITVKAYAEGRDAETATLFGAQFDANHDGTVTADEYQAALAGTAAVEAYHHATEERMSTVIEPALADKNFDLQDMRGYMTKELGLTGDWPYLMKVFNRLDLNQDGKLLSAKGEGPAFMLTFARPQLQHLLKITVSKVPADGR